MTTTTLLVIIIVLLLCIFMQFFESRRLDRADETIREDLLSYYKSLCGHDVHIKELESKLEDLSAAASAVQNTDEPEKQDEYDKLFGYNGEFEVKR